MNNDPSDQQANNNQSAQPPVVTAPVPVPTSAHNGKDLFKTLFLILTPLLVALSLVGGILLGRTVFKEKTLEEKFLEEFYGEDLAELDDTQEKIQSRGQDTERRTDINSIATQLEAYYADYGYYPSNANARSCDDGVVTAANCTLDLLVDRGLDSQALIDPNGIKIGVFGSNYAYEVSPAGCNNCDAFILSADLAEETTDFTRQSLN